MNGFKTLAQLFNIDFDEESFLKFIEEARREETGNNGKIYELACADIDQGNYSISHDFVLMFIIDNFIESFSNPHSVSIIVLFVYEDWRNYKVEE